MPINADIFRQAYTTVSDTSQQTAAHYARLGQTIGQAISAYGDRKRQEREDLLSTPAYDLNKFTVDDVQVGDEANATQQAFIENLNAQRQNAANDIVNEAANLQAQYKGGKISREEFNEQYQGLQKNLTDIQNYQEWMNARNGQFKSFQDDPESVSNATSNQSLAISKAMDDGRIKLEYDEDTNKMRFKGTYTLKDGGEEHEFNVENPNQFPGVVTKVDDPSNLLLNTNLEINKLLIDASVQEGDGSIVRTGTSWEDPADAKYY